ncbi:MAG: MurR/RpiR family transcriptional regulator [Alphaproteobacteria bacterium]
MTSPQGAKAPLKAAELGQGGDIIQGIVAIARGDDRTMAGLARWLIDHQSQGGGTSLSISDLAQATGLSETTVFRFCKHLGLKGYTELRLALAESRGMLLGAKLAMSVSEPGGPDFDSYALLMRRVVDVNSEQLLKTLQLVSPDQIREATAAMMAADHIHLVGFGSSAPVAFDFYQRLLCLGVAASAHSDPHVLAAITANAKPGVLFLGISSSGRTRDLIEAFETAGEHGLTRIAITSDTASPLAKVADITLVSAVRLSVLAREELATRISQLAIVEMLSVAVAIEHPNRSALLGANSLLEQEIAKKRMPEPDPSAKSDPANEK